MEELKVSSHTSGTGQLLHIHHIWLRTPQPQSYKTNDVSIMKPYRRVNDQYPLSMPKFCSFFQPSVTTNSLVRRPKASRPLPFKYGTFLSASVTQSRTRFDNTSWPNSARSGATKLATVLERNTCESCQMLHMILSGSNRKLSSHLKTLWKLISS